MRTFGRETITTVSMADHPTDRDRYNKPLRVETLTAVRGCHFRPVTFEEQVKLGDTTTEEWKLTAPPVGAVTSLKPEDQVRSGGVTYQVIGGPKTYPNYDGQPFKVTVMCKRWTG